jgi:hypothetical protein
MKMESTMIRHGLIATALAGMLSMTSAPVAAQTAAAATPRAANAANPAAAPTPKLTDGHPDLNGTWDNGRSAFGFAPNAGGTTCVFGCAPAAGGARGNAAAAAQPQRGAARPAYKPEFIAKVKDLDERQVKEDPALKCRPPGLPRIGPPDKIVQTPGQVVFLYDDLSGAFFRIIPTDGRGHRTDVDPNYLGDSVGRWEKDTLVVEAVNFNDDSWLIDNGAFHTTGLRVVERLRRVGNTIEYEATAYDPAVLAEPWVMRPRLLKLTRQELSEPEPCVERSLDHLVTLEHHDNPR